MTQQWTTNATYLGWGRREQRMPLALIWTPPNGLPARLFNYRDALPQGGQQVAAWRYTDAQGNTLLVFNA